MRKTTCWKCSYCGKIFEDTSECKKHEKECVKGRIYELRVTIYGMDIYNLDIIFGEECNIDITRVPCFDEKSILNGKIVTDVTITKKGDEVIGHCIDCKHLVTPDNIKNGYHTLIDTCTKQSLPYLSAVDQCHHVDSETLKELLYKELYEYKPELKSDKN